MPAYQSQLTSAEIWDIVHYVQSLRVEAHESELVKAGINSDDMGEARRMMWATVLNSTNRDAIDREVIRTKLKRSEDGQTQEPGEKTR